MRLTKDESRILAHSLQEMKYSIVESLHYDDKKDSLKAINKLQELEDRLTMDADDRRRKGRTTKNSFTDTVRRYIKST